MSFQTVPLEPGLYLVATPIGNARDITLRALDVLASADVLACEDTRTTRKLLDIHGVAVGERSMIAYHDHNGAAVRPRLLGFLAAGQSVAYASDAGTPLVADPGFALARAAIEAGHRVSAIPGASAALAALSVSGLPSDRFTFAGFAPTRSAARRDFLRDLTQNAATVILFESPKRVQDLLNDLCEVAGGDRQVVLCRELTKKFEETRRGTLAEVIASVVEMPPKGECVLLIGPGGVQRASEEEVDRALHAALEGASMKDASQEVAEALGWKRRDVYQRALALRDRD
ncbi:MAG: 16S rRNA (cytidine(1402)-2'-O)-methyltransferase [Pseudomonadota bacterium]